MRRGSGAFPGPGNLLRDGQLRGAVILCIAALLGGCGVTRGQLEAAATFGKSASALADGVKNAYAQAAQDEADVRTAKWVVLSSRQNFDPTPIRSGSYRTPLIRLSPKDISGRYAAASALTAYGQALTTLLDVKSQEGDLASATDKLTGALKGIPAKTLSQARVTPTEIDNVGRLITVFGDLYLDYRRREVLELIVPKTEPIVTKLCAMFGRDFDIEGGMFATIFFNDLDDVITSADASIQKHADALHDRAILLPIYQRTRAIRTKISTSYASLQEAARSCSKSSIALAKSIQDPTPTLDDIMDFATKAQVAYNAVMANVGQK
jgi:hypothetical protein